MEPSVVGWDADAPGKGGGETGVAAFGEVDEGEEGPDEGGAGAPCVEGVEDGEMADPQIDQRGEDGEEDSRGGEGWQREQKDGVGDEVVQIGGDEQEAREDK